MEKRKRGRGGIILLVLLAILLLTVGGLYLIPKGDFTLEMELIGPPELTLEYGMEYQEPGVTLRYYGTQYDTQGRTPNTDIKVTGGIEPGKLGRFELVYSAEYKGCTASVRRVVHVIDTKFPVITLEPNPDWTPGNGERFPETGYTALDNFDGDITSWVTVEETEGKITYTVEDSSGNPGRAVRSIPGYDPVRPVITLEGGAKFLLRVGQPFEEPGYSAWDNMDGDLSRKVIVEGTVDRFIPGNYPIFYSVTDKYGNTATVVRSVEIVDVPRVETVIPQGRTIYLTFDDGPSANTDGLLDVLAKYGVKATFFVTNSGMEETLRRIVEEGHGIGVHTMTHDYGEIYQDEEAFFQDLYGMQDIIFEATGVRTYLMRFPGGSSNTISHKNQGLMTRLTKAVQNAGFTYFDWNVDSGDASGALDAEAVLKNVKEGVLKQMHSVVLQHDIHPWSVEAVEQIILWGLDNGYNFLPLDLSSPECHHNVAN